jgi:hypothetical protein
VVKKSGELEKVRVHWHVVAYPNKFRADGFVKLLVDAEDRNLGAHILDTDGITS